MTALVDLSDVVNRSTGGSDGAPESIFFHKDDRTSSGTIVTVAGLHSSLFRAYGFPGGHGSVPPSGGGLPSVVSPGGLRQTNPAEGAQKWLLNMNAAASSLGTLTLYDRLFSRSGFSGTLTSAQEVDGVPDRYTGAESVGNQIWIEINSTLGSVQRTITANYTDQDGNASVTQPAIIGGTNYNEMYRMIPLPLAAGDTGVQSVVDVTLSGSTATAGDFWVTILRPLLHLPISTVGVGYNANLISGMPGPIEIKENACLAFMWLAGTTAAPRVSGSLFMVES